MINILDANLQFKSGMESGNHPLHGYIHHADMNGSVVDVHNVHLGKGWCGIGYDFYIRKNGEIWRGRPLNYIPAGVYGYNQNSVHICCEGNFEIENPTPQQIQSCKNLIQYLKVTECPDVVDWKGHKEVYATDCPGKNFPLEEVKQAFTSQTQPKPIQSPPGFNENLYLSSNTDILNAVKNKQFKSGLEHYLLAGFKEGRNMGGFNEKDYLSSNSDILVALTNKQFNSGLQHYVLDGFKENRNMGKFIAKDYLELNSDVAKAVKNGDFPSGLHHYVLCGFKENRQIQKVEVKVIPKVPIAKEIPKTNDIPIKPVPDVIEKPKDIVIDELDKPITHREFINFLKVVIETIRKFFNIK